MEQERQYFNMSSLLLISNSYACTGDIDFYLLFFQPYQSILQKYFSSINNNNNKKLLKKKKTPYADRISLLNFKGTFREGRGEGDPHDPSRHTRFCSPRVFPKCIIHVGMYVRVVRKHWVAYRYFRTAFRPPHSYPTQPELHLFSA